MEFSLVDCEVEYIFICVLVMPAFFCEMPAHVFCSCCYLGCLLLLIGIQELFILLNNNPSLYFAILSQSVVLFLFQYFGLIELKFYCT